MKLRISPLCLAVGAVVIGTPSLSVSAQDGKNLLLEEIVVTARKKEESLQDVPMALKFLSKL